MKNIVFLLGILPFLASAQLTSLVSHGNYYWVKNPSTGDSVRMLCPADTTNLGNKLAPNGNGSALTGLTKTQVGLSNVDNTSDVNKPISSLTQAALDAKQATGNYVTSGGALGTPSSGTLTNCTFPTLNQNTSGTASNLSGTPALPNGTTATTQTANNNSTSIATTAYVDAADALKANLASPTFTGTVTLPASTSFTTPVIGAATGTSVAVSGAISSSGTAGIGYVGSGVGGAVTQSTSRSTGVTLNKICGTITGNSTSLAASTSAVFVVTNSTVALRDVVLVSLVSGATANTSIFTVSAVAAGSFSIRISNISTTTADTGAPIINFIVIKAANN